MHAHPRDPIGALTRPGRGESAAPSPASAPLDDLVAEVLSGPRQPGGPGVRSVEVELPRMLDSIDEFAGIVDDVLARMRLDAEALDAARRRGCRTFRNTWTPHAGGYVGHVTNGRWWAIVKTQIEAMKNDLAIRQFNGDWRLGAAVFKTFYKQYTEQKLIGRDGESGEPQLRTEIRTERHFLLAIEFIDVSGQDDIRYNKADGLPMDDTRPGAVGPELLALLREAADVERRAASSAPTTPAPEGGEIAALRAENAALRGSLGDLSTQVALLVSQMQGGAAPASAPAPAPASTPKAESVPKGREAKKPTPQAGRDDIDRALDDLDQG